MTESLEDLPSWDEEPVFTSSSKYHRSTCSTLRNVSRTNFEKLSSWKKAADRGLEPCLVCRPYFEASDEGPVDDASTGPEQPVVMESLETLRHQLPGLLNAWRHELVQLLNEIDPNKPSQESVAGRISRLSQSSTVPRHIAVLMRVVTEMRNKAEYEAQPFSHWEIMAVIAAHNAVSEWAGAQRSVGR